MKSQLGAAAVAALLASLLFAAVPLPVRAQNPDALLPQQSAARARAILEQAITALGGPAFLHARDSDCNGRLAQFQHSGDLGGYVQVHEYWATPDKSRVEYGKKHNIAQVYAGHQGWTLDRGGVSEMPPDQIADYREQVQTSANTILRYRLRDPELVLRYDGSDVVDLREVDWVEASDKQGRLVRIAVAKLSHLPIRSVLVTRNPKTGELTQRSTAYSAYQTIDGIQTPFRISRYVNGRQVYQVFYRSCRYNSDLPAALFARASLDEYFAKHHK